MGRSAVELDDLRHALRATLPQTAHWAELSGGRTNRVWRVQDGKSDYVCKLYRGSNNNPLFANVPEAEFACLTHLAGQGLSPDPVVFLKLPIGMVLIYKFLQGRIWQGDTRPVAQCLHRLHALDPPADLPQSPVGAAEILLHADRILNDLRGDTARYLRERRPEPVVSHPTQLAFLHGDVVAANLLQTPDGLRLIDWQCPSVGDPVSDLACFLSPAMQVIYGAGPLSQSQQSAFLEGYGDRSVSDRYLVWKSAYHYRMAAYCLWRVEQGQEDYLGAFAAELAAMGASPSAHLG